MPIDALRQPAAGDPTSLYRYRDGLYAADLMTAAIVHLDFFTWLAEHPSDIDAICSGLDLAPRPADVLLTLCAANGLVASTNGVYAVTPLAREHLVAGSPFYLAPYYASLKDRPVVTDFLRVLRSGKPAHWGAVADGQDWHAAMEDDTFARSFTAAMDCRGLFLAQALSSQLDLSGRRKLLDIGGGSGIYACVLAAHHPGLQAVVFDQAPVDRIAARLIAERECEKQVHVLAGSFFNDPWPDDCDVHLFSNVLHDWGFAEVRQLLAASYAALPAGGLVVIHESFINADKTGPLPVAEYSTILMHSTRGKCYATSEYEPILLEAGFADVAYADTVADRGFMTARKP
jgi:predicted O-methyltransferase YrrM